MAEPENPAQIAPGEEAAESGPDTPYTGWQPSAHRGLPLNGSFELGASTGRA